MKKYRPEQIVEKLRQADAAQQQRALPATTERIR